MPTRIDLICAEADQSACDIFLTDLFGSDQSGSLCIPLGTGGAPPITHYGASGVFEADEMVPPVLAFDGWASFVDDGTTAPVVAFDGFAVSLGLARIIPDD